MATEKTLKTRVVLKHDTEANWKTAGNAANPFIPKKGEVIIYDPDGTHTYSRQKVGDGIKNINELPFLGATVGTADSSESLSKIQYMAESAIPTAPEQGVEYAITDAIGYGDLDSELQAKVDAGANAGSNLNTKASVDYVNKTHYGYSGDDLLIIPEGTTTIANNAYRNANYKCVVIPDGVTSIGNEAFSNCTGLTSITIPDSVTSIGNFAFWNCTSLTSITIPNSVTSIGEKAFQGCMSLTSVTIPNSITSTGNEVFSYCSSLTSVAIENGVTSIGNGAFSGCSSLKSVVIPDSVTSIGRSAFDECSSLTSITIPDSVTSIGNNAFSSCAGLTSITIPNGVTSIGRSAFFGCGNLKSVTIGNGVTSISESAFHNCSSLTSITIGNSVSSISFVAFSGCPLTAIDLTAYTTQSFPTIEDSTFNSIASNCQIKVIKGRKNDLIATKGWSSYASYVVEVPTVETLDTAIAAVKNGYLPLSGGTVSGAMTISGGITTQKITTDTLSVTDASGKISVTGSQLNFGQNNGTVTSTITGISDSIGTSSTVAVSQKCLTDNYVPINLLTSFNMGTPGVGINGTLITLNGQGSIYYADNDYTQHIKQIDTSITIPLTSGDYTKLDYSMGGDYLLFDVNTDKLAQAFLPLSGGTISNTLTIGANSDSTVNTLILTNNAGIQSYFRSGSIELWEGTTYPAFAASSNGISINGGISITGITDTKGTSVNLVMSQKGVADNYVAKSELPSNLLKYQIVTSTSQIGTDANTAYLILE